MREHHTETDILRLAASFAVVLLHVSARRLGDLGAAAWLVNSATRWAVPLFVMVSGRYMLSAPCPIRRGLSKAGRALGTMLLWSGLYLLHALCRGWRPAGWRDLLARLLTEPVHLWYFWAIAALYLFTPLLSVFTCHAGRGELRYAVALTGLFGSVVTLLLRTKRLPLLAQVMDRSKIPWSMGLLFCYLLGYHLVPRTHTHTCPQLEDDWPLSGGSSQLVRRALAVPAAG